MKTLRITVLVVALCLVSPYCLTSPAFALCKVGKAKESEESAKKQETKLRQMLLAMGGDSSEKDQVILVDPGTATTIATGKGLTDPRPWTAAEKARLDGARVNPGLPEPKGVWK